MRPYTVFFRGRKISSHSYPHIALQVARAHGPGWRIDCATPAARRILESILGGKPVFRRVAGLLERFDVSTGRYVPVPDSVPL